MLWALRLGEDIQTWELVSAWWCTGIRTLQCILLKVALLLGVEVYPGVTFDSLIEPPANQPAHSEYTLPLAL